MTNLIIRPAIAVDTAAVAGVITRAYELYHVEIDDLPDVSGGVADDITNGSVWVAEKNRKILGCLVLNFNDNSAYLSNVAVDPIFAGEGIGKALIETAQNQTISRHLSELKLTTHVKMPENVALYTHLGWIEMAREGNKVFMTKKL